MVTLRAVWPLIIHALPSWGTIHVTSNLKSFCSRWAIPRYKRQVWLSVSGQLHHTGRGHCVPRTSGPRLCFLVWGLLARGREGWGRGATGSSPSQRLFQWNHRERFVTVGPALAQSPHTMPASIYLYPAEREVFVWDALNSHMQNGCLFVPIIHARSLNLNSPLPSAAPFSSRLFSAWNINEFLMIPNGTPPPHSPPLAPQRLSVNYRGVNCARRAARFCKPTANAIKVCSEPLGEHKYLVNSFVLHLDWSHSSKEKPSDWQTSERRSRFY